MPRRKQKKAQAKQAAQKRQRGRAGAQREAQDQAEPKRAKGAKGERKPRVHADLLTVAFRGPLAGKFRELAERCQMTLAGLLQDALLAYEANIAAGYQPGTALAEWKAQQASEKGEA